MEAYVKVQGEEISASAYRTVYKAIDRKKGIEVAWNEVDLDRSDEEKMKQEMKILKTLESEHIVRFFHYWVDKEKNKFIFITELMTSGTLRSFIRQAQCVCVGVIKNYCRQILEGLSYLHNLPIPIIHRDIKLDNIYFRGAKGKVKIGDLGLATMKNMVRRSPEVFGTPAFMAPELFGGAYDEKVDIWAFGMCVIEMTTLLYPYEECTEANLIQTISAGIKPHALAKIKDPKVFAFTCSCLEMEVKNRLSAKELLKHPFICESDVEEDMNYVELRSNEELAEVIALIPPDRKGWEDFIQKTKDSIPPQEACSSSPPCSNSQNSESETDDDTSPKNSEISGEKENNSDTNLACSEKYELDSLEEGKDLSIQFQPTIPHETYPESDDDQLLDEFSLYPTHASHSEKLEKSENCPESPGSDKVIHDFYSGIPEFGVAPTTTVPEAAYAEITSTSPTTEDTVVLDDNLQLPTEDDVPSNKSNLSIDMEMNVRLRSSLTVKKFRFKYDLNKDTPLSVAEELIRHLKIPLEESREALSATTTYIQHLIQNLKETEAQPKLLKPCSNPSRAPIQRSSTAPVQPPPRVSSPGTSLGKSAGVVVTTVSGNVDIQPKSSSSGQMIQCSGGVPGMGDTSIMKRASSEEELSKGHMQRVNPSLAPIKERPHTLSKINEMANTNLLEFTFTKTKSNDSPIAMSMPIPITPRSLSHPPSVARSNPTMSTSPPWLVSSYGSMGNGDGLSVSVGWAYQTTTGNPQIAKQKI